MRKFLVGSIVGIAEAHRLRQALDSLRLTGEEMPAVRCASPVVAPDVLRLPHCREARRVVWIDAHGEHVKILPNAQGEHPQGPEQPVEYQRAEIWTIVINQAEDDRFAAKIVTQEHGLAGLIPEGQIERNERV